MSLTQIVNGETGLSTRTKLNTLFARIDETFVPSTGVQLDTRTIYNPHAQSGALVLNIAAGSVNGGTAVLSIDTDGDPVTVVGATKSPKSDDAAIGAGHLDKYEFERYGSVIEYKITNIS